MPRILQSMAVAVDIVEQNIYVQYMYITGTPAPYIYTTLE